MSNQAATLEKEMKDFIAEFCEKIGPRAPCSEEEKRGAEFFYDRIKGYCDEIETEKFHTYPGAYKAAFKFPMVLYIFSITFYVHIPWLSLIFNVLSMVILWGTMAMARQTIDKLFPKKPSQNVIGKIKPKNEPKITLIIGGHIDSNWEFPLIRKLGYFFALIFALNIFFNVILFLILIIENFLLFFQMYSGFLGFYRTIFWLFVAGIPVALIQFFFVISNRPVMGANDDLSGLAVCIQLAKNLSLLENKPNSVEVMINAYGCEEIGSKGSRAFVNTHYDEIKDAKVINLDMIGNKGVSLRIGTSEIFGLVKLDKNLKELMQKVAERLNIQVKSGNAMAFTDSMSFARKGIASISLMSMPKSSKEFYYHTRDDVIENMGFQNLVDAYKICMEIIKQMDD